MSTLLTLGMGFSNAQPAPVKASKNSVAARRHSKAKHRRGKKTSKTSWKRHGQQGIQPDRAREIQEALIRQHYLNGEPSGVWDGETQEAMERFQNDNGWQTKITPDSRALIKLGLGPDYSQQQLLNLSSQTDAVASAGGGSGSASVAPTGVAARDKQ